MTPSPSRAGAVPLEPAAQPVKTRILIVDDNKDLAGSLARLLRILGHDVEVVFEGRKGIVTARTYRPRVVLLDIGLPNLDGYHVARTLRQEGFNDTMIIALSGYGQEEDQRRPLPLSARPCLWLRLCRLGAHRRPRSPRHVLSFAR